MRAQRLGEGVGMTTEIYRPTLTHTPGSERGPRTLIAKMQSSILAIVSS